MTTAQCRTCCGTYPISCDIDPAALIHEDSETLPYQLHDKPPEEDGKEMSYDLIFEMELKKRQLLSQAETV
jgi:hypothetical protein